MNSKKNTKDAIEQHKAAKKALEANATYERLAGIDYETDEYLRLNREVVEAETEMLDLADLEYAQQLVQAITTWTALYHAKICRP